MAAGDDFDADSFHCAVSRNQGDGSDSQQKSKSKMVSELVS